MTDPLKRFGVDRDNLPVNVPATKPYPVPVVGRIAHIDADFMAYQAAADRKDELDGTKPRKTVQEKCEKAKRGLEHLMRAVGATNYIAHITPSGSTKGDRDVYAVTLPYQGNRLDRERPEHLDQIRAYISTLSCKVHLDQEADDGMAQANYQALQSGCSNLSVIVSKDKDLRMVPGLHYDFDTEAVVAVGDPFGWLWIDTSKSSKTLKGWGTKFFWAQCLMGDTADNIRGLPFITYRALDALGKAPTTLNKLNQRLQSVGDKNRRTLLNQIEVEGLKIKKVGAIMANDLLADCNNDAECFKRVRALFKDSSAAFPDDFIHHGLRTRVTGTQALFGDMLLLWMRRTPEPQDVLNWLKEERLVK